MVHTTFLNVFKAMQQKVKRIPIHIQQKIRSLIDQGHIVKLGKMPGSAVHQPNSHYGQERPMD